MQNSVHKAKATLAMAAYTQTPGPRSQLETQEVPRMAWCAQKGSREETKG